MRVLALLLLLLALGACEEPPPDPGSPGGLEVALPRPPGPGLPDDLRPPR